MILAIQGLHGSAPTLAHCGKASSVKACSPDRLPRARGFGFGETYHDECGKRAVAHGHEAWAAWHSVHIKPASVLAKDPEICPPQDEQIKHSGW